jgi:hypothetical protein
VRDWVLDLIPTSGTAIDIGVRSGRDAPWLASLGHQVIAVGPSRATRDEAPQEHPYGRLQQTCDVPVQQSPEGQVGLRLATGALASAASSRRARRLTYSGPSRDTSQTPSSSPSVGSGAALIKPSTSDCLAIASERTLFCQSVPPKPKVLHASTCCRSGVSTGPDRRGQARPPQVAGGIGAIRRRRLLYRNIFWRGSGG